jgi:uncharacterized protein (DUF488 family)
MQEIWTIGHSTRTLEDFIKILKFYEIEVLVDVRHFPHSKNNPQFNKEILQEKLFDNNIVYKWIEKLGGFREGGYKKYIETEEFKDGLEILKKIARDRKTAVMCAEILWFKCHRRYIADILKREKWKVYHIYEIGKIEKHKITLRRKIKCDR